MTDILVVDDNEIGLRLVSHMLAGRGYSVRTARDAVEALALIARSAPTVILMDIRMPGMDGHALTRMLKADPATSHIAIIAVTACAMEGDEEKARAAGCDGYVSKPIDVERLLQLIRQYCEPRQRPRGVHLGGA